MSDDENEVAATDKAVQEALMNLLEVKLDAFMGRADLSSSPPEDKVAIRAAFFLGVTAGMQVSNSISGADGEQAAAALDKQRTDQDEKGQVIP